MCILLDGHDLIVEVESVCDPLEAGDLLVLFLHNATHLLHLSSEILPALSIWIQLRYTLSPEISDGLLQVGAPGQRRQGPGVGLHVIGAEQQQRAEVEEAHVSWPPIWLW